MMLLTWAAMLLSLGNRRFQAVPLSAAQRTSLVLGGAFAAAVLISFFTNNMLFYGKLTGSMVEVANYVYCFLIFATTVWLVDD